MDEEIKNCECGGEPGFETLSDCVIIRCSNDDCDVNEVVTCGTREEAIEEWNEIMI